MTIPQRPLSGLRAYLWRTMGQASHQKLMASVRLLALVVFMSAAKAEVAEASSEALAGERQSTDCDFRVWHSTDASTAQYIRFAGGVTYYITTTCLCILISVLNYGGLITPGASWRVPSEDATNAVPAPCGRPGMGLSGILTHAHRMAALCRCGARPPRRR